MIPSYSVNAVLNYDHLPAEKSGIKTNRSIDIPDGNVDICNIVGNIPDNAIAACEEISEEQRWIQFTITSQHNANLYFVAANSFSGKVKLLKDRYLSTNRDGNGIGLSSIESIAEKYNATAYLPTAMILQEWTACLRRKFLAENTRPL